MSFNAAQTFYLDPSAVKNSPEVGLSKVDLFFRAKPKATGNKSGISNPGVEVIICQCINGVPSINEMGIIRPSEPAEHGARFNPRVETARVEWGAIAISADGSTPTTFKFENPILVPTNQQYAIVVKFDGNEDYVLWYARQGDVLANNSGVTAGPAGKYIGNYYSYISPTNQQFNPALDSVSGNTSGALLSSSYVPSDLVADTAYLLSVWKPNNNMDLKFRVYVARHAHKGVSVTSNATITADPTVSGSFSNTQFAPNVVSTDLLSFTAPSRRMEYLMYDRKYSPQSIELRQGEMVFQKAPFYPGGRATPLTISTTMGSANVVANGSYVLANGTTFNAANGFNSLYDENEETGGEAIIIWSGNTACVRKLASITSNTTLVLDHGVPFTNTAAYFYKAPIAILEGMERAYTFGRDQDMITLRDSNANATVRFVNNCIESISPNNAGSGYSNSDYVVISGFETVSSAVSGGYNAVANLVTNSSGSISALYMANNGCGFVNTAWLSGANVRVLNSTASNSTGTGATFALNIGCTIHTESESNTTYFANCQVINLDAHRIKPEIMINNPLGTAYAIRHRTLFNSVVDANTFSGRAYYVDNAPSETDINVKMFKSHQFPTANVPIIASRSNQFVIKYANGAATNTSVIGTSYSNVAVYIFDISSNNDYIAPFVEPDIVRAHYSKYVINNDYTGEHTNYGNAYAKHVAKKINFKDDRLAEDMLIYLTAYRPANTDLKVYARIHNSKDPEAFDDKDWTLLELIDGIGVYSSKDDTNDFHELTYNFSASPNSAYVLGGSVEVTNVTTMNVVGSTTTFTSNLAVNDLVKIYSPIFPNNYVVSTVTSITSNTLLSIGEPTGNLGVTGTGLKIAKIEYPHQGFNNLLNDNVVRYFNSEMVPFDGYDTFQVKVIFTSDNDRIVPKFDDVRGIGVTA